MSNIRCHDCNSAFTVASDRFGNWRCYQCVCNWIGHIKDVIDTVDGRCWCQYGGLAGPAAVVVADEERTDSAAAEAVAQNQAADAGSGLRRMEGTAMLVLSRRKGEQIVIGDDVVVEVTEIKGTRVKLAIHAPKDVRLLRSELEPKDGNQSDV